MTDLNVTITCPETGEVFSKFSVYRGTSFSLNNLIKRTSDSIRSELLVGDFVLPAQKESQSEWQSVTDWMNRMVVPGGWLYRYPGYKQLVFVPDPDYHKPRNTRALMDDGEYPLGSNV